MSSSTLDRGLTSGGLYRLAWFEPRSPNKLLVLRYTSLTKSIPYRTSVLLPAIADISPAFAVLSQSIRSVTVASQINRIPSFINLIMSLPTQEVKGTTILFEVEVDLDAQASDAILVYFAEGTYAPKPPNAIPETFQITSLTGSGITLESEENVDGIWKYKWKCRVAPEQTRSLTCDSFITYCRLFFGLDIVELERSPLMLNQGKPDLRPS